MGDTLVMPEVVVVGKPPVNTTKYKQCNNEPSSWENGRALSCAIS